MKQILRAGDLASNSPFNGRSSKPDYLLARSINNMTSLYDPGGTSRVSLPRCTIPFCVFRTRNVLVLFRRRLLVGWTNCFSYSLLFIGRFEKLFYTAFCVFMYKVSVGWTNCSSYSLVFLERGKFMYQSFFAGILFYPAFCVFRTRN